MSTLEEAILKHTDVTVLELRKAQLEYPICGTIEALSRKLGHERSAKFMVALSEWSQIPLFAESDPVLDHGLYTEGGERLLWLITAYRALPLVYKTEGGVRTIQLAMTDPFDIRAQQAFELFCGAPVKVKIIREVLLSGIVEKISGKSIYAPTSRMKMSSFLSQRHDADEADAQAALRELVLTASQNAASSIELELDREFTRAIFLLPFDRIDTVELKVPPEILARAVVEQGQVNKREEKSFYGSTQIDIDSSLVTCALEYHQSHLNRAGNQGRALILKQLSNNPEEDPNFWHKLSDDSAANLRTALADNRGIFLTIVQQSQQVLKVVASLGQICPTLGKAYAVAALKKGGELAKRAQYSAVLVGMQAQDVVSALGVLEQVPPAVRALIKGVITYSEVPKACPFCGQRCRVDEETTSLLPESLSFTSDNAIYPRGCNYCEQKGYLGEQGLISFLDRSGALDDAIKNGVSAKVFRAAFYHDKRQDFLEQALTSVQDAATTVEALARAAFGRSDVEPKRTLSVGKVLIGSSGEVLGVGGDKSSSVGGETPTASMIGHHSVVLDMGFDLMAARDAVRAQGESAFGPGGKLEVSEDSKPLSFPDDSEEN